MQPKCRRCNGDYVRCYCSRLEYHQQWWKWGEDRWPSGSTVYSEQQRRTFRVVNDPGPVEGAMVEVREDPNNGFSGGANMMIPRAELELSRIPDYYSGRALGTPQE